MQHLVLIDGHHLMYRAYWAIPRSLRTSKGEQVNAVFGMASMLLHILHTEQPDALVLCFDAGDQTFRHQENETYKDGRAETPDDFYVQIPRIAELVDALGFCQVSNPEYEADDYLGSYATAGAKAGMRVTVVTGDKDALQLAADHIRIAVPHGGYQKPEYLGPKEVEEKFGIRPDQVADYKGLVGDSSDNLPGVRGIGPKTAADVLQRYGSLDALYEHLDALKPVLRKKLEDDREQAFFCRRMATLVCDLPLPASLHDAALTTMPVDAVLAFFRMMEFGLLERRLLKFLSTPYGAEHFYSVLQVFDDQNTSTQQLSLFS